MKSFEIVSEDGKIKHIYDLRYETRMDITNGEGTFGCACYTKRNEDVNTLPKRRCQPHGQYFTEACLTDDSVGICCEISQCENALKIRWAYQNSEMSKFAGYLPLNFLGQKNGDWKNQFLVSSPQYDPITKRLTCLFTRPDGNHLMLITEKEVSAFRIDYWQDSHYIIGFEIIENLDRSYGAEPKNNGEIIAYLVPVSSYLEGLSIASKRLCVPCAYYSLASAGIGDVFHISVIGQCDRIIVKSPDSTETIYSGCDLLTFPAQEYGFYTVTPMFQGKSGIPCTCFARYDWETMYQKSIESVPVHKDKPLGTMMDGMSVWMPPYAEYRGYIDTNLCEHSMWAWSQLCYMRHNSVSKSAEENIKNLLNVVLADNISAYRPRQTLMFTEQNEPRQMCACNTYKSDRIQETFNGASILLAAWKVFHNNDYLEYAVTIIDTLLKNNLHDGAIIRNITGGQMHDYTSVTGLILPVVDLYTALSELSDPRANVFKNYSEQIADFVVRRDMCFPTETILWEGFNEEYEDGAISCSALSVLYVAHKVIAKPEYIQYAEKVLHYHDAFSIYTYHTAMYRSSLRWWENIWEGDADGPAICCGHAWTIWRAESEYWLGLAKYDSARLLDSYNGFMSNFSKQDQEGNMYSLYQCEPCISGAYSEAKDVSRRFAIGFPAKKDTTLSRYVYARGYDTWLSTTAVLPDGTVLNGKIVNGELKSNAFRFSKLYLEPLPAPLSVSAIDEVEIYCRKPITCIKGKIVNRTEFSVVIKPSDDGELVLATT